MIVGDTPKDVVKRYVELTGPLEAPPEWAFGLWASGGFRQDRQEDVLARARNLHDHGIPCDVIHLDCYWQRFGFWSEMRWDRKAFPDPRAMIAKLHEMGLKLCLWTNPYLSERCDAFAEARDRGYLLKDENGDVLVLPLWGDFHPPVGIVDFTSGDATSWFKDLLRPLFRDGVDVIKTDFGEGIPVEARAASGLAGDRYHNLYPLLYNDAVAEVTREETGRQGLIWARCTGAGGQRHGAQWGGDPTCSFEALASTLRGGLNLAMCGHAFWSHDIGGFHGTPTPELYVRWAQFGLLSPMSRMHGRTSRLPWAFGHEAERIVRNWVRFRYRLIPYLTMLAREAEETGVPMIRPLALEFPGDPSLWDEDLSYMLGDALLVAPVYNVEGERPVRIPEGRWIPLAVEEDGVEAAGNGIDGPATFVWRGGLSEFPLYARAGRRIPGLNLP